MASKPISPSLNFAPDTERLDQHFLDRVTADRIVGAATIVPGDVVLDIGSGTGILTAAILRRSAARVIAIETDQRCRPYLERLHKRHSDLTIMLDRIQNIPRADIAATTVIIANPPFSALEHLVRLLRELPKLRQAIMCVSRRWADAATAQTASPDYGVTSVAIQSRFNAATIGLIDGSMFTPPIRKPAALLELSRRREPDPGLDLLADTALTRGGLRLKDFLRSRRLRQTLGSERHRTLLNEATLRRLQQRRLRDLTNGQISAIAALLELRP